MTFLWFNWFLFIAIFLIWQHFSKMWPLKGAASSTWAWVSWPCTSVSPVFKIFWEWYHCIHLFHWFWSCCSFFLFNEEISQRVGQRETQGFVIWLWCCCQYEADAACNRLCSLVCICSPHPWPACTFPPQWPCSPEITGDSGPLKRGHGSTKIPGGDIPALAIM